MQNAMTSSHFAQTPPLLLSQAQSIQTYKFFRLAYYARLRGHIHRDRLGVSTVLLLVDSLLLSFVALLRLPWMLSDYYPLYTALSVSSYVHFIP